MLYVVYEVMFDFDNFISYENEIMAKLLSKFFMILYSEYFYQNKGGHIRMLYSYVHISYMFVLLDDWSSMLLHCE